MRQARAAFDRRGARTRGRAGPHRPGVEPVGSTPDEFRALIAREVPQWREVIRAANIRAE